MMAKDMRVLAEKKQKESTIEWWRNYKVRLFEYIERIAIGGEFQLSIDGKHKLNELDFISSHRLREHATKELESMGYEVDYYNGSYQSDGYDKSLTIKW